MLLLLLLGYVAAEGQCTYQSSHFCTYDSLAALAGDTLREYLALASADLVSRADTVRAAQDLRGLRDCTQRDHYTELTRVIARQEAVLWGAVDSLQQQSYALYKVGRSSYLLGDFYPAFDYASQAIEVALEIGDSSRLFYWYNGIALTMRRVARYDDALEYSDLSRQCIAGDRQDRMMGDYYNAQAMIHLEMGNTDLARLYGDSTMYYWDIDGDDKRIMIGRSNRTMYYEEGDSLDYRIDQLLEIISHNQANNYIDRLGSNYGLLAKYYRQKESYHEALHYHLKALDIYKRNADGIRPAEAYQGMSLCYAALGEDSLAYRYLLLKDRAEENLYKPQSLARMFQLQMEYDATIKDQKKAIVDYQRERVISSLRWQKILLLTYLALSLAVGVFLFYLYHRRKRYRESQLQQESDRHERTVRDLERKALRSQMNPHFIFNSLNSIKSYIIDNESRQATNYLNKFAHLVRLILQHSGRKEIALEEELTALEYYTALEKLRVQHGFEYYVQVAKTIDQAACLIPPLILQPYVENAIWHGLLHSKGPRLLSIEISKEDQQLQIRIKDNGVGRAAARQIADRKVHRRSFGHSITKDRIKYSLDEMESGGVDIEDLYADDGAPAGTLITLVIPYKIKADVTSNYIG